jgi:transcriptional regulator with PAS, ATPase and Fis domain
MEKFIALSQSSKKILKIAQMSAELPINIIILGESGVGRKALANEMLANTQNFDGRSLEKMISEERINLKEYKSLIIYNINKVLNKNEFLDSLKGIKIIATGFMENEQYINQFAIKLEIPPLEKRREDLDELIKIYTEEASKIYASNTIPKNIKIDISGNAITLKQSIYKSILFKTITKQELMDTLKDFFIDELKNERNYKNLLEIFEIPLLRAAKIMYKSQLKMATKLNINRITLRKKLHKYFGE